MIKSKECVDSLLFISANLPKLRNIDVRKEVEKNLREYYIELANLLTECGIKKSTHKKKREDIKTVEELIFYERNKREAHRDDEYKSVDIGSIAKLAETLKEQITHVRELLNEHLPKKLTLDFVAHDRTLFRMVSGVTYEAEEKMKQARHPLYNADLGEPMDIVRTVLHSPEQLLRDKENLTKDNACVILEAGINPEEGLQNRQRFCVSGNILFYTNRWWGPAKTIDKTIFIKTAKEIFKESFGVELDVEFVDDVGTRAIELQKRYKQKISGVGAKMTGLFLPADAGHNPIILVENHDEGMEFVRTYHHEFQHAIDYQEALTSFDEKTFESIKPYLRYYSEYSASYSGFSHYTKMILNGYATEKNRQMELMMSKEFWVRVYRDASRYRTIQDYLMHNLVFLAFINAMAEIEGKTDYALFGLIPAGEQKFFAELSKYMHEYKPTKQWYAGFKKRIDEFIGVK